VNGCGGAEIEELSLNFSGGRQKRDEEKRRRSRGVQDVEGGRGKLEELETSLRREVCEK
jgi:hypothetical protein